MKKDLDYFQVPLPKEPEPEFKWNFGGSVVIDGKIARKNGNSNWDGSILGTKQVTSYKIKILTSANNLGMIGFATSSASLKSSNYSTNGYYLYVINGTLYSKSESGRSYTSACYAPTTIIEARYENNNISFVVNGKNLGNAFTGITEVLFPAIDFYGSGSAVEFLQRQMYLFE